MLQLSACVTPNDVPHPSQWIWRCTGETLQRENKKYRNSVADSTVPETVLPRTIKSNHFQVIFSLSLLYHKIYYMLPLSEEGAVSITWDAKQFTRGYPYRTCLTHIMTQKCTRGTSQWRQLTHVLTQIFGRGFPLGPYLPHKTTIFFQGPPPWGYSCRMFRIFLQGVTPTDTFSYEGIPLGAVYST